MLMMVTFDSLEYLQQAVMELRDMSDGPSALEFIDGPALEQIHALNPNQLRDVIEPPFPPAVLLVEFDNGERQLKKIAKQTSKLFERYATSIKLATEPEQQQRFRKLREAIGAWIGHNDGLRRSVPLIDDGAVPPDQFRAYLEGLYKLLERNGLKSAVWGHAGEAMLHVQPKLNLGQVGDRQKAFRMMEEHRKLVTQLSGTTSAENGDGRLRTPYLEDLYGPEVYALLTKIKQVFDPYNTLNPGVKFGTTQDDIKEMVRTEYSLGHLYDHLPRS
jgi:FAD/FMN-containing dehydrogenase